MVEVNFHDIIEQLLVPGFPPGYCSATPEKSPAGNLPRRVAHLAIEIPEALLLPDRPSFKIK